MPDVEDMSRCSKDMDDEPRKLRESAAADYVRRLVERVRFPEPQKTPEWVVDLAAEMRRRKLEIARQDWTGRIWMFLGSEGASSLLGQLCDYMPLEEVPGWSPRRQAEAVRFWQSWQNTRTGRFYDPSKTDPQDPDPDVEFCNEKYVVNILRILGAEPLYPHTTAARADGEAGAIDTEHFLAFSRDLTMRGGTSWFGMMCMQVLWAIEAGRTELIPILESGIANALAQQDPKTGLWDYLGQDLADYAPTAHTMKFLARVWCYMGAENIPHMDRMVDTILENVPSGCFARAEGCIPRNVVELLADGLEISDYRRDDLFAGMRLMVDQYEKIAGSSEFTTEFALGILGGYLHWKDCPLLNPMAGARGARGAEYTYKVVVQDDGAVRISKKAESELVWNQKP